jgi:cytochrome P450
MRYYRKYGPVFTTRFLGGIEMVWCIGPEANQYILVENAKNFLWREGFLGDLIPFIGDGLLTTDGETHDRARRLLNPLFSPERIRRYAERMIVKAMERVDRLRYGERIEIFRWARETALEIAGDILFGFERSRVLAPTFSKLFDEGLRYYAYPLQVQYLKLPFTPWARLKKARRKMEEILLGEILRRRKEGAKGENILDLLIRAEEEGDVFTDKEIVDQALTLLFAGHDTSTCTITWMMVLLGQNRIPYLRLHEEVDSIWGKREPSPEDLFQNFVYLDKVLAETLRLYPPAWVGPRRAIEDFEIYGVRIPGGTNVAYSSWLTHHLPHVYPDPESFDPERFDEENKSKIPPGAYVPFGRGKRLCIGMRFGELEVKTVVASLLSRFHLELVPGQDFRPHTMPTLSPRYGVYMNVLPKSAVWQKQRGVYTFRKKVVSVPSLCPVEHTVSGETH